MKKIKLNRRKLLRRAKGQTKMKWHRPRFSSIKAMLISEPYPTINTLDISEPKKVINTLLKSEPNRKINTFYESETQQTHYEQH